MGCPESCHFVPDPLARAWQESYRVSAVRSLLNRVRFLGVLVPLAIAACATEVTETPPDDGSAGTGGPQGGGGAGGSASTGGKSGAGQSGSSSSTAGTGISAFGGTSTSGGSSSGGSGTAGSSSGGTAGTSAGGTSTAGSGGKATGGSSGSSAGGSGGASGGSGGAGGSAGSTPVGTGSCADTPAFVAGDGSKYAKDALVFAVCKGGTPCTLAKPPLTDGKTYEFKCLDQYNCGKENPGTTNWGMPPWVATKACEE